jgi:hypothetical protein
VSPRLMSKYDLETKFPLMAHRLTPWRCLEYIDELVLLFMPPGLRKHYGRRSFERLRLAGAAEWLCRLRRTTWWQIFLLHLTQQTR